MNAFSIDIKDLYYSIPQNALLTTVADCIDSYGVVAFQNSAGIAVSSFLELLSTYLGSTHVEWKGDTFLQKDGICIGSCIAPVLSDIFLAKLDRLLQQRLSSMHVLRVFRFVDDFLVVLECDEEDLQKQSSEIISVFSECLAPLVITYELPVDCHLRFLDLGLHFSSKHVCWEFQPRAKKPILMFHSSHSKLVKRGIAHSSFDNALKKSCVHRMRRSFDEQVRRLTEAGYPRTLLSAVAEKMLRLKKQGNNANHAGAQQGTKNVSAIPYIHSISHNLKKVAERAGVKVVFTAPEKLAKMCRAVNEGSKASVCTTNHRDKPVHCAKNVVYSIPLNCGASYIGQTGRCLNERLKEHKYNTTKTISGHLGIHCRDCGCAALMENTSIMFKSADRLTREIVEALEIKKLDESCVSMPSVILSDKDIRFLTRSPFRAQ